MNKKFYSELITIETFIGRYNYLRVGGSVGEITCGYDRIYGQQFYRSKEWKLVRDKVIIRDRGRDLGIEGREIYRDIIVHHINPITIRDIESNSRRLYDMENLITTTQNTHRAIHYGNESGLITLPIKRQPKDTILW